jgi:hypothetical protein
VYVETISENVRITSVDALRNLMALKRFILHQTRMLASRSCMTQEAIQQTVRMISRLRLQSLITNPAVDTASDREPLNLA